MTVKHDISKFTEELLSNRDYKKKILIEGDSWVSHPQIRNLSDQFNDFDYYDYLILNIASPGDEANSIFRPSGSQMKRLKRLLKTKQWGDTFDLIFLSAAGNDIVGPEIVEKSFVKNKKKYPFLYGHELITGKYHDAILKVVNGYEGFLNMRDTSVLNDVTPVITHVYSYLKPRKIGTSLGPFKFNNGWVMVYLEQLGIVDEAEQKDIITKMLDIFYQGIKPLESKYKNFMVVNTLEVLLKDGEPDLSLWHDEIHPNNDGFKKIAEHIRSEAKKRGIWNL